MHKDDVDNLNTTRRFKRATLIRKLSIAKPRRPVFVVVSGFEVGRVLPIPKGRSEIGRDPVCYITLDEPGVSRRHAEVRRNRDGSVTVRDIGSTNGLFIGEERVDEVTMRDGDKVVVGPGTVLRFEHQDAFDQHYQQSVYDSSVRDPLTGLFNRRHFDEQVRREVSYATRHHLPLSLLMLDIDHFKRVNDTYGHPTGDVALQSVAEAMQGVVRDEDDIARYGGEEFVLATRNTDLSGAVAIAEKLRQEVAATTIVAQDDSGRALNVTISVGVVTLEPGAKADGGDLVAEADRNLYAAKQGGRDCVRESSIQATG